MRVVFLTHNYPRSPGDVAGNFLHPLAVALGDRGIAVRVIAPSDGGQGGEERLDGITVERVRYATAARETLAYRGTMAGALRSPGGVRSLAGMIRAFTRAARTATAGARDVVLHAHWWVPAGLAAPAGPPLVITCHGTDVRLLSRSRTFRFFGRRVLRRADVVTTVSGALAATLREDGGVEVADDAIQPMPVADRPRPRSVGGGGIVMLGRLTEQKRIGLALEAFAEARSRGLTLPLTIIGEGLASARLKTQAGGLGLGRSVSFLGAIPPDEVPGHLARADLCLMTAEQEGLGLAAVEALIQGVPVVACRDGGGLLDVVPSAGAGRVVAPTPADVATGMLALLDDPDACDAAFTAGQQWAARLTPSAVAERCEAWYRRALEARP
jgi:glycosyltransferase involved in cell wall biosynthesis